MSENNGRLTLYCNEVATNPLEDWRTDLVEVAFLGGDHKYEYIVIARTPYEDDIYIEHNDQGNCLYAYYENVAFALTEKSLLIDVENPETRDNLPCKFKIIFAQTADKIDEVLAAIKLPTEG